MNIRMTWKQLLERFQEMPIPEDANIDTMSIPSHADFDTLTFELKTMGYGKQKPTHSVSITCSRRASSVD